MMYKCQMCLVVNGDNAHEVVSEERIACNPLVGLDLAFRRLLEKAALERSPNNAETYDIQLLGWADPIVPGSESDWQVSQQRMVDRARNAKEAAASASQEHDVPVSTVK